MVTLTITLHGSDTARCVETGDEQVTLGDRSGSPIGNLCRRLIAARKADPEATVKVMRDGTLCFRPAPLRVWTGLKVFEGDDYSVYLGRYHPPPCHLRSHGALRPRAQAPTAPAQVSHRVTPRAGKRAARNAA